MTGRSNDGDGDWDGPEWAAPERAERLASRPVEGRGNYWLGLACRMLTRGAYTPEHFRRQVELGNRIKPEKETQA